MALMTNRFRQLLPSLCNHDRKCYSTQLVVTVKKLIEDKKLDQALERFKKYPTPQDAAFMMGKGYNLEECLEIYEILKKKGDISISVVVSMISTINSNGNKDIKPLEYCNDLIALIRKQKNKAKISPITWSFTLKQLGVFSEMFEQEIFSLLEEMLKCHHVPSEGIIILLLNKFAENLKVSQSKEIINLLNRYEVPLSVKYYTIYLKTLILSNRIKESIDTLQFVSQNYQLDSIFYTVILSAINRINDGFKVGEMCHHLASSENTIDLQLANTLISFYCGYSKPDTAYTIFCEMKEKNIVSWNNMLSGFVKNNCSVKALDLFNLFLDLEMKPNEATILIVLDAYASSGNIKETKELLYSMKDNFGIYPNVSHYGCLVKALLKNNNFEEVLILMNTINQIKYNPSINILIISACMRFNNKSVGMDLLDIIVGNKELNNDLHVMNVLLRMLTKFGEIEKAILVFNTLKSQSRSKITVSVWTTLIHGLGINGRGREAIQLFNEMMETTQISPDPVTITSILTSCSHSGLIDEAVMFFNMMNEKYGIEPSEIHYCCMVDVFGRGGLLEEAEYYLSFVKNNLVALITYLGACRKYNNIEKAEIVFNRIMEIDEEYAPAYVLLSNIYSSKGLTEKRNSLRLLMEKRGVKKVPGISYITINGKVHSFVCEEKNHIMKKEIYEELDKLSKELEEAGFKQDTSWVTKDIPEEEKSDLLCKHSEKIAIAYGLISTPEGTPLTIVKNLRVCGDCHEATKFISKLKKREIVLTDANRVHHFKNGTCSCSDYF